MDLFIEHSVGLITARPDTTRVSTRFTHKKSGKGGERVDPNARPAVAIIKTYDPVSGTVYKYKLTRVNELSRIMACLGPHMVDIGTSRKRGVASLMSDIEPKEMSAPALASELSSSGPTAETGAASTSGQALSKQAKHKKKKGKK